jgi:hypothetical protein
VVGWKEKKYNLTRVGFEPTPLSRHGNYYSFLRLVLVIQLT